LRTLKLNKNLGDDTRNPVPLSVELFGSMTPSFQTLTHELSNFQTRLAPMAGTVSLFLSADDQLGVVGLFDHQVQLSTDLL